MKAIYASKLYKASKRKSQIHAAMENPLNAELVQQLREYVDEEYLTPEVAEGGSIDFGESEGDTKIKPSEGGGGGGGFSGGGDFDAEGPDLGEMTEDLESERAEDLDFDEPIPEDDSGVAESQKLKGKITVSASEQVEALAMDADAIRGLLNSRQDSTGAVKISVVDNELWIYFDEGVNLNEVMEPAIATLNASGYTSLNFKKLSRSDNAITFDIDEVPGEVKPVAEVIQ